MGISIRSRQFKPLIPYCIADFCIYPGLFEVWKNMFVKLIKDIKECLLEMEKFEPFGEGNPAPVFKVTGFIPETDKYGRRVQLCGSDLTTVRLQSTHGTAIGFNMSSMVSEINESLPMTLYGTLSWNYFNGRKEPQIEFVGIENEDLAA